MSIEELTQLSIKCQSIIMDQRLSELIENKLSKIRQEVENVYTAECSVGRDDRVQKRVGAEKH